MNFESSIADIWIIILCVIFAFFYIRALFAGLDRAVPRRRPRPAIELEAESIEEEISEEARRREEMTQKVIRLSQSNPERIASIVNKWLLENGW